MSNLPGLRSYRLRKAIATSGRCDSPWTTGTTGTTTLTATSQQWAHSGLNSFSNILPIKTVSADYQPIPWFTIFFGLAHVVIAGVLVVLIRNFKEGREGKS